MEITYGRYTDFKRSIFFDRGLTKKPSSMIDDEWNNLDRKAIATIRQYLANNVYSNVSREKMEKGLWKKLHDIYKKNMA